MLEIKNIREENYIFGLDIGTRSIVGIVGYQTAGSFRVVADYVLEHDTRAMMDGQIHDVDKVAQTIKKVKHELEKSLPFELKRVCIAAAGRVLKTKTVHVEQETDPSVLIDEDRVYAIELLGIERAHQEVSLEVTKEEVGYHCVGYTVSRYYLNEYEIGNLIGHKGKKIGADVLATFLPKEVVESLYRVVEYAGLSVHSLTLEPIAAIRIAIPSQYRLLNIALVDIGAGTSDIAITKEGSIIAYGMLPYAGDELTEVIVHHYLVDFKTAESIKIKSSTKCKTIAYKDIMGMAHKDDRYEVEALLKTMSDSLALKIASRIKELNGGSPTNAVFLVGGGGQLTHFTDAMADALGIARERVALRGKAVLDSVEFETNTKKTPDLVTPLGICFSGFEGNKHEFVQVFMNDEPVKVFDTNHLTVMDIAAFKGFNPKSLIATRGENLTFILDGAERIIKGETGEPAEIRVNNGLASLNDRVVMNDYITMIPAKRGRPGVLSTYQLMDQMAPIVVYIQQQKVEIKPRLKVNGIIPAVNYDIKSGDVLETSGISLKELIITYEIPFQGHQIIVNGEAADLECIVKNMDLIELLEKKQEPDPLHPEIIAQEKAAAGPCDIHVMINGERRMLQGKAAYVLVDIFDVYDFDLSRPQGIVECKINGNKAAYMESIHDGDVLNIYWSEQKT